MALMPNHYETLGVAKTASTKEIRKAYLRRARALHPDRQQGRSPSDARRAEEAMQQVNVAWNVLSDTKKKSEYDNSLRTRSGGTRSPGQRTAGQQGTPTQRRVNNPPPRSPKPSGASSSSSSGRSIDDEPGDGSVSVWASLPVLIIVGIGLGLLIITAFGNSDGGSGGNDRELAPELDSDMRDEDCFIFVGDSIMQVSCDGGRAEGRVIATAPDASFCPANTESTVQGEFVLCFERLIPGSTNAIPNE